ncbi:MAG: metallophosphoesterase family protein [Candidatus Latescibacterota bacterium]|jgi:predicted phosphodiesterase
MRRLWLADVHANLPAFEAVLADAASWDEIVFLGDIVGYGPHPSACVERLRQLGARGVRGNHDTAVLAIRQCPVRRSAPVDWDEWSFDQLDEPQRSYLATLPLERAIDCCGVAATAMHHPAGAPYLHPAMPDAVLAGHLRAVAQPMIVCGHSHRRIDRVVGGRRYVCVPPVGQPRDGDSRAGYAVEADGELAFHRVSYDLERTVADVGWIGLEEGFCQRWVRFLRTGWDPEWSRECGPAHS